MDKKTFLFWNGLCELSKKASGKEKIFMGVRPFGFHGGNKLTLLAYPWHFCNELEKNGKKPKFTFFVSINDMEPHQLKYLYLKNKKPYYKKLAEMTSDEEPPFPYNIFPEKTSFQFTKDPFDCCNSVVDHWQNRIENEFKLLKQDFPGIKINFVRNSKIKNEKVFLNVLEKTIKKPEKIAEIVLKYSNPKINLENLFFSGAICPECHSAQGKTVLEGNRTEFSCSSCGRETTESIKKTDFWIHHMPLLVPRLILFDIDICIRGGDHYQAKRVEINRALMKYLSGKNKNPISLISPMLMSNDGHKMSKSWFNEKDVEIGKLMRVAENWNKGTIPFEKVL